MSSDQVGGIIRTLLAFGAGWLVTSGYIDAPTASALSGALVTLIVIGWSLWTNKTSTMIASINAGDNGVKVVASDAPAKMVSAPLK